MCKCGQQQNVAEDFLEVLTHSSQVIGTDRDIHDFPVGIEME